MSFKAVPLAIFAAACICTASPTDEVERNIDLLRGITVPGESSAIAKLNERMDTAWRFLEKHKAQALPRAKAELKQEIDVKSPDQFFLMDVGYFLIRNDPESVELPLAALQHIDPTTGVIQANWQELFHFAMRLGESGKFVETYLAEMDRIFLTNSLSVKFFAAPHWIDFNPADQIGFVYGVVGEPAAAHLDKVIAAPGPYQTLALRMMSSVGSEADVPAVEAALNSATTFKQAAAAITVLMEVGGPSGQAAVLRYDGSKADEKTRQYLNKVRNAVASVDIAYFERQLASVYPTKHLSKSAVKRALDQMDRHNGADDETPPIDVFRSGLPANELIARLKKIRALSFRRENNHVFGDLPITNLLINGLQFKAAAK
jgi:hypothetical protein